MRFFCGKLMILVDFEVENPVTEDQEGKKAAEAPTQV